MTSSGKDSMENYIKNWNAQFSDVRDTYYTIKNTKLEILVEIIYAL